MRVIGLCGAARSGKDTAAEGLVTHGWTRMAFADPVRAGLLGVNPNVDVTPLLCCWGRWFPREIIPLQQAVAKYGWERLKTLPEVRGLLQRYGTEGGRDIHGFDCWIDHARTRLAFAGERIVFTDVRFANESRFIQKQGGKVVRIERPGFVGLTAEAATHSSEHSLNKSHWDAVLINNGTVADLWRRVLALAAHD